MNSTNTNGIAITSRWARILLILALVAACGGGTGQDTSATSGTAPPVPSAAQDGKDQNACRLLTHDEVSELVGETIVMSDQTDAGETWSTCQWENERGLPLFSLTVYWTNGKEQWDAWRAAHGLGQQAMKQAEGVGPDDVVKQGPVAGIGDAAYFSPILPSLVLKGDVLVEMNLFFVTHADARFAGLAAKLVAKIG